MQGGGGDGVLNKLRAVEHLPRLDDFSLTVE